MTVVDPVLEKLMIHRTSTYMKEEEGPPPPSVSTRGRYEEKLPVPVQHLGVSCTFLVQLRGATQTVAAFILQTVAARWFPFGIGMSEHPTKRGNPSPRGGVPFSCGVHVWFEDLRPLDRSGCVSMAPGDDRPNEFGSQWWTGRTGLQFTDPIRTA